MALRVKDIIEIMEKVAPGHLAEKWDNVGLQVGNLNWPVKSIWFALDPSPQVVDAACRGGCDLLITHHPLIFKPLKKVDISTPVGSIIKKALHHQIAIFAAHTNLDAVRGGLNDRLAKQLDLSAVQVLKQSQDDMADASQGIGRIGTLPQTTPLNVLAEKVKKKLQLANISVAGRPDLPIDRVAVCTGSGSGLMADFMSSGAQVYISGDLHYHDARDALDADLGLIDIGHFASEQPVVDLLAERIQEVLAQNKETAAIKRYQKEKNPFYLV